MSMTEEEILVVDRMKKYGGSFVKALAECFYRADPINFQILKKAFSKYWEDYSREDGC